MMIHPVDELLEDQLVGHRCETGKAIAKHDQTDMIFGNGIHRRKDQGFMPSTNSPSSH